MYECEENIDLGEIIYEPNGRGWNTRIDKPVKSTNQKPGNTQKLMATIYQSPIDLNYLRISPTQIIYWSPNQRKNHQIRLLLTELNFEWIFYQPEFFCYSEIIEQRKETWLGNI